jgi:hypothetical protein
VIKYSGCKGCHGYSGDIKKSCNGRNNKSGECPCSYCLVKGMCTNECQLYIQFIDKVYQRETTKFLKRKKTMEGS